MGVGEDDVSLTGHRCYCLPFFLSTRVRRMQILGSLRLPSDIDRTWRSAAATVPPLEYRGRSLHLVMPHTDVRERDSHKNQRRPAHALSTLTRTQHTAIQGNQGHRIASLIRDSQTRATYSNLRDRTLVKRLGQRFEFARRLFVFVQFVGKT
jgi:hypothetical protein